MVLDLLNDSSAEETRPRINEITEFPAENNLFQLNLLGGASLLVIITLNVNGVGSMVFATCAGTEDN